MIQNHETILRQTLILAILHDIVLSAVKSVGSVNTMDENKLQLITHDEICNALNQ